MFSSLVVTDGGTSHPEAMHVPGVETLLAQGGLDLLDQLHGGGLHLLDGAAHEELGVDLPGRSGSCPRIPWRWPPWGRASGDQRIVGHGVDGWLEGLDLGVQVGQVGAVVDAEGHSSCRRSARSACRRTCRCPRTRRTPCRPGRSSCPTGSPSTRPAGLVAAKALIRSTSNWVMVSKRLVHGGSGC